MADDNDNEYKSWYRTELSGWKGYLAVMCMLWCLGSGLYTLALLFRRLTA